MIQHPWSQESDAKNVGSQVIGGLNVPRDSTTEQKNQQVPGAPRHPSTKQRHLVLLTPEQQSNTKMSEDPHENNYSSQHRLLNFNFSNQQQHNNVTSFQQSTSQLDNNPSSMLGHGGSTIDGPSQQSQYSNVLMQKGSKNYQNIKNGQSSFKASGNNQISDYNSHYSTPAALSPTNHENHFRAVHQQDSEKRLPLINSSKQVSSIYATITENAMSTSQGARTNPKMSATRV